MHHILTFTSAPNSLWLLCLMYVVHILNTTAKNGIADSSPHQHLYSQTPNISPTLLTIQTSLLLRYQFISCPHREKGDMGWFCP